MLWRRSKPRLMRYSALWCRLRKIPPLWRPASHHLPLHGQLQSQNNRNWNRLALRPGSSPGKNLKPSVRTGEKQQKAATGFTTVTAFDFSRTDDHQKVAGSRRFVVNKDVTAAA